MREIRIHPACFPAAHFSPHMNGNTEMRKRLGIRHGRQSHSSFQVHPSFDRKGVLWKRVSRRGEEMTQETLGRFYYV